MRGPSLPALKILFLILAAVLYAPAQSQVTIATADTNLTLAAEKSGPKLISLQSSKGNTWKNGSSEKLIEKVRVGEKIAPVIWELDPDASHVNSQHVAFVYNSAAPRLQLVWEWQARSAHGPVEHTIRIRNLGSEEVWAPLQDSFAFDWELNSRQQL